MKKIQSIQGLKDYYSAHSFDGDFYVKSSVVFETSLDISFDDKQELSDWVNEQLDSDDFDVDHDLFIDDTNDIINVVADYFDLKERG